MGASCVTEQWRHCLDDESPDSLPEVQPSLMMHEEIASMPVHKTLAQELATSPANSGVLEAHKSLLSSPREPSSRRSPRDDTFMDPKASAESKHSGHGTLESAIVDTSGVDVSEVINLRQLMKQFVQDMVKGQRHSVLVASGSLEDCKLYLTPNLQYLQLVAGGETGVVHDVPLKSVKDISTGTSLQTKNTPLPLDELCATLMLRNNECVTFKFQSLEERDNFARCVKVLALALDP